MASTTSAMFLTIAEAVETGWVTRGCPSGTMPREPAPVVTGQPRCSASARSSAPAPERCVPPPQWISGSRALTSISAARRTISGSAGARPAARYSSRGHRARPRVRPSASAGLRGTRCAPGPGRPVTATSESVAHGVRYALPLVDPRVPFHGGLEVRLLVQHLHAAHMWVGDVGPASGGDGDDRAALVLRAEHAGDQVRGAGPAQAITTAGSPVMRVMASAACAAAASWSATRSCIPNSGPRRSSASSKIM